MGVERRRCQRRDVIWKAALNLDNGEHLLGSTANVSRSGMFVIVERELDVGNTLDIELFSCCTGPACYFRLEGEAVYNMELGSNLGIAVGIALKDPDPRFLKLVLTLEEGERWLRPAFAVG